MAYSLRYISTVQSSSLLAHLKYICTGTTTYTPPLSLPELRVCANTLGSVRFHSSAFSLNLVAGLFPKAHSLSHFLDSHLAPIPLILGFVLSGPIHRMYQLYPFLNPYITPLLTMVL